MGLLDQPVEDDGWLSASIAFDANKEEVQDFIKSGIIAPCM